MTHAEKAELLKTTIQHLYENEGRSKSYIGKLLDINRSIIQKKIKEWDFKEAEPRHHLSPSWKKFVKANRQGIKSMLDHDYTMTEIAKRFKIDRKQLYTILIADTALSQSYKEWTDRKNRAHLDLQEEAMKKSSHDYHYTEIPSERSTPVLGFEKYEISDHGRVRVYVKRYKRYFLLKQTVNTNNGRLYVNLINTKGKRKNLQVANLTAHAYCSGYDKEHNTVNHDDGDVTHNHYTNLTWTSQSENNTHAYRKLNRTKVTPDKKRYQLDVIRYQDKYEFKTVAAFARFLGKSETQVRRYMDEPEKHNIQLIRNCND